MELEPKQLWQRCLEYIHSNISQEQYDKIFPYVTLHMYKDGNLVLNVPNTFVQQYLEEKYLNLLQSTFKHVFNRPIALYYNIQKDSKPAEDVVATPTPEPQKPEEQPVVEELDSQLRSSYNFSNYVEGESNRLARSVGESIAKDPARTFNPFFIFGPSGCGKTHLVNAIGLRIKELHPELRVLYLSAHLFMVQWTDAVRHNVRNDFIAFYQTIDVLIIDDIQELSGKTDTQNTFFHIFNHLQINQKQIILTADRPPMAIQGLEDRLLTRFKWGLQAEIEKPTQALRLSILNAKVRKEGLSIPSDVLEYISKRVNDSVRDLEGIINSLMAHSIVYNCDIDMNLIAKIMPRFVEVNDQPITVEDIKQKVCSYFNISIEALDSRSRKQPISYIRQMAIYLANKHTATSNVQIGNKIGGRNHATVIHAISQIKNQLDVDEKARIDCRAIEDELCKR